MARKKKARRTPPKKTSSLYKKALYALGISGVGLVAYCYFTAHSDHIPIIAGPEYPKRTPGVAAQTRTYAVYDRLAQESSSNKTTSMARLLPPDETPEWENPEEITPHHTMHTPSPATETASAGANSSASSGAGVVPAEPVSKNAAPALTSGANAAAMSASSRSASPKIPSKGAKDIKKSSKDGRPNKPSKQSIKSQPSGKKVVRMQMGGICDSEEKAQKLVQQLMQQGGMPSGKRLVIQKAVIRGKPLYRVILIGS